MAFLFRCVLLILCASLTVRAEEIDLSDLHSEDNLKNPLVVELTAKDSIRNSVKSKSSSKIKSSESKATTKSQASTKQRPLRRAKVVEVDTAIYEAPDFDAAVIRTVDPDEVFVISNKTIDGFYKLKLKDGTLGFVPDTELDIEGLGKFKPKPYVEDLIQEQELKKMQSRSSQDNVFEDDSDTIRNPLDYHCLTVHLINYHENTLGAERVADLVGYGYRMQPLRSSFESGLSYEFILAPTAPKYYRDQIKSEPSGGVLWVNAQISNTLGLNKNTTVRYGVGPFLKYSYFKVPTQKKDYVLQDVTAGLVFQGGFMFHFRSVAFDVGLNYFWDKKSYSGFNIGFLF